MTNNIWTVLLLVATFNPFSVYLSVKWGRFGYLRANEAFDIYQKRKNKPTA